MVFELPSPEDDGLYKEVVGSWSADKHHFLRRYIDAFTTAMKNKPWAGLHYVDLFCGPGIVEIKDGPLDWGSPLIAAQSPNQFTRLHLCDKKTKNIDALNKRLELYSQPNRPQVVTGDSNILVGQIISEIPTDALTLAFLDPHGLHLEFDTVKTLSDRRADLIIFFPDHLDALRNWEYVYKETPDSNLTKVLGRDNWLEIMSEVSNDRWAEVLQNMYIEQIASLGYRFFEDERIAMPNGRFLYKLIFCTRHELAAKLWRGTSKRHRDGQGRLFE